MKFVNLTPHEIVLKIKLDNDGNAVDGELRLPSNGNCRVAVKEKSAYNMELDRFVIPVVTNEYGDIEGLPHKEEGTIYIVSLIVLNALKTKGRLGHRPDVVAPDTGKTAIREDGKIVAVTQFVRN